MYQEGKNIENNVRMWLEQYSGSEVCLANELCDRHAVIPERVCLFYEAATGYNMKLTYAELSRYSIQAAGFLKENGVRKGDRVAVMLPKTPEFVIIALAIWRLGAILVPLFTAFGVEALQYRLDDSHARVLVINANNRHKVTGDLGETAVVVVAGSNGRGMRQGDYSFWSEIEQAEPYAGREVLDGDETMLILYTSGTMGPAKGCEMPVKSLAAFKAYMRYGLDVRDDDMFWNMADPGWAYGLYYNVIGSLLLGKAMLFYNGNFDAPVIYKILEKYRVTNWTGAPTAYKQMAALDKSLVPKNRLNLRVISSAGEPLNPSLIKWAKETFGVSIYDHYGQSEGGMMANNHHHSELDGEIKPVSMGKAMPGYKIVLLNDKEMPAECGHEGEMAIDLAHSPLFCFRRYWNDQKSTAGRYTADGRYYLTGDMARMDEEGYIYYIGRKDEIILSSGYRIGPFEVENVIMHHYAVADVAVVGVPDEMRGEIIKAFIVLKLKYPKNEDMKMEIKFFVKKYLSGHAYPREIQFVDWIPRTSNGKIQRMHLKGEQGKR